MRLVQVIIPAGKREAVLGRLDEEGIDYVLTDEISGREYVGVVYFPLPTEAVEPILAVLREEGLDDQAYTVVVDARTVISKDFEALQDRFQAAEPIDERIAREELITLVRDLAPTTRVYAVLTAVSAVVAAAGLLLDSPAVVVGSMVIAPLIGPAMSTAVGTVVDDRELFLEGVKYQLLGFGLAIGAAAVFAALVRSLHLVQFTPAEIIAIDEVRERLAPDILSLAVALGAGAAGAFSLSTGVSTSLVGVMIAVALVPPAATVGIGIAWGRPLVVLGSGVLALVNALSINLAALAVLWYTGYRPEHWFQLNEARTATIKRFVTLLVAVSVLTVFLGGVTYDSYDRATTERQIKTEANAVVEETEGVTLLSVDVIQTEGAIFQQIKAVVIVVGIDPGQSAPSLADRFDSRVDQAIGADVPVQVRYVTIEESS